MGKTKASWAPQRGEGGDKGERLERRGREAEREGGGHWDWGPAPKGSLHAGFQGQESLGSPEAPLSLWQTWGRLV